MEARQREGIVLAAHAIDRVIARGYSVYPDAACEAGLSEEDLKRWEDCGEIETPVNLKALTVLLGLDSGKSMAIAEGWGPREVNLNQWSKLNVLTTAQGFEVNSYVVWDPDTREAAMFDTGWFADDIFSLVEAERLNIQYLFITK